MYLHTLNIIIKPTKIQEKEQGGTPAMAWARLIEDACLRGTPCWDFSPTRLQRHKLRQVSTISTMQSDNFCELAAYSNSCEWMQKWIKRVCLFNVIELLKSCADELYWFLIWYHAVTCCRIVKMNSKVFQGRPLHVSLLCQSQQSGNLPYSTKSQCRRRSAIREFYAVAFVAFVK